MPAVYVCMKRCGVSHNSICKVLPLTYCLSQVLVQTDSLSKVLVLTDSLSKVLALT